MIYQSEKMRLNTIRVIAQTKVNDILICEDLNAAGEMLYTVLAVRDHSVVKKLLQVYEQSEYELHSSCVESFSDQGVFVLVYPYFRERSLEQFYMGESYPLAVCEEICINTILACISAQIPYPLLYLILEQRQLQLAKDHNVYLEYTIDLEQLDTQMTERDCVVQCAKILRSLLAPKARQKAVSYQLLDKKIVKKSYYRFTELYKDVRIAAVSNEKKSLSRRMKAWFLRNRDWMFRLLLRISVILLVLVAASFLTQVIFGDIPWLRLFFNGFKQIGTQSLLQ